MKQIKSKWLHVVLPLALFISIFSATLIISKNNQASAAPVGCYVQSTGSTAGSVSIVAATCPSGTSYANKCWLSTASSQGQSTYREVGCDTIQVGTSTPAAPAGGGGSGGGLVFDEDVPGRDQCGKGDKQVQVGFNIGCRGNDYPRETLNPIVDMAFAVFRVLSVGVGMVVIGSIIVAGIQYSASRGNPQATQASIKRITSAITALLLYVFMFAIANFVVPGGMFI